MASGDKYTIEEDTLVNIGDAIREMTETQEGITPENMPTAIRSISGGDTVSWNQIQDTGTKIAEIDINGTTTDVYTPKSAILYDFTLGNNNSITVRKTGSSSDELYTVFFSSILNGFTQAKMTMSIGGSSKVLVFNLMGSKCGLLVPTGDYVLYSCADYDETSGKYTLYIAKIVSTARTSPLPNIAAGTLYTYEITKGTEVSGTLTAGSTSLTLSDSAITTDSTIQVFTDPPEIPRSAPMTVSAGSVTLTFEAQQSNVSVKVRIL